MKDTDPCSPVASDSCSSVASGSCSPAASCSPVASGSCSSAASCSPAASGSCSPAASGSSVPASSDACSSVPASSDTCLYPTDVLCTGSDYASCSSTASSSDSDDSSFTASYFQRTDVTPMPIEPSDDVFHNGKGADEFFDEVSGDTSSLSASEECSEGSSDANFSNITFSLPGNDFRIYFPGNSDLLNKITQVSISNEVTEIGDCIFQNCSLLTNIKIPNSVTVHTHTVCVTYYKACAL